jgi:hypothetical protein
MTRPDDHREHGNFEKGQGGNVRAGVRSDTCGGWTAGQLRTSVRHCSIANSGISENRPEGRDRAVATINVSEKRRHFESNMPCKRREKRDGTVGGSEGRVVGRSDLHARHTERFSLSGSSQQLIFINL